MHAHPAPFELLTHAGHRVASNGAVTLTLLEPEGCGRLFRRRGLRGVALGSPGAQVLPEPNRLAGDLLAQLDMPPQALAQRLQQLLALASPAPAQPVEWAVAELDGVRVYVDGSSTVIVTRQDIVP
jgi:hypothetical protein